MKLSAPKSSLFSFGKKAQLVTPPAVPAPAVPPPTHTTVAPLSLDDLLKAAVAGQCVKDGVPQERFNELLKRARAYAAKV